MQADQRETCRQGERRDRAELTEGHAKPRHLRREPDRPAGFRDAPYLLPGSGASCLNGSNTGRCILPSNIACQGESNTMSTTVELLERWKQLRGITSDNQAAIALGLTRATISL